MWRGIVLLKHNESSATANLVPFLMMTRVFIIIIHYVRCQRQTQVLRGSTASDIRMWISVCTLISFTDISIKKQHFLASPSKAVRGATQCYLCAICQTQTMTEPCVIHPSHQKGSTLTASLWSEGQWKGQMWFFIHHQKKWTSECPPSVGPHSLWALTLNKQTKCFISSCKEKNVS